MILFLKSLSGLEGENAIKIILDMKNSTKLRSYKGEYDYFNVTKEQSMISFLKSLRVTEFMGENHQKMAKETKKRHKHKVQ